MQKIIDLHCDTITEIQAGVDIEKGYSEGHLDIPRLQEGTVGCQVFACFVSSMVPEDHAFQEVVKLLELTDNICEKQRTYLQKVEYAGQIKEAIDINKIAILTAIENGHTISNNLRNLESLRLLGSRYMTLTHMKNLKWAASSGESHCDFEGLTNFGEKVVTAMNEMGMIGINFYPGFLNSEYLQENIDRCSDLFTSFDTIEEKYWQNPVKKMQAFHDLGKEFRKRMYDIKVGYETIVDHIAYIINLVGDDFVGFGSDFDGLPALPEGMTGCDIFPSIISLLENNDFSDNTIAKICRDNFLRVLEENK